MTSGAPPAADGPPVPFLDLARAARELAEPLEQAAQRVLRSGWYIGGEETARFERAWAAFCGTGQAVGTGNGLDALTLMLRAHGIGPGDEVLVPAHTFVATWLGVGAAGATPVPVEPLDGTGNLDPAHLEAVAGPRARAVVAVHLYGQPADMDSVAEVAGDRGLLVFEDAAQAHGARWRGVRTGALAAGAAFSFYPAKNLGALGDAGAVTTADPDVAGRVRLLGSYGSREKYMHEEQGVNSRLDPLQAALLEVKLTRLEAWNARRAAVAEAYLEALEDLEWLRLPEVADGAEPAWHLFVVRAEVRDALAAHLARAGVETAMHYPVPVHRSGAFAAAGHRLPRAEAWSRTCLSLPIGPHLETTEVERVIAAVRAFGAGG